MDIVLAMLANNAAKKIDEKKWEQFPYNIERNAEVSERTQNLALYRYLVKNALRYPQNWVLNNYGAKTLVTLTIQDTAITIHDIEIVEKTEGLSNVEIEEEVRKTLNRASRDFPTNVQIEKEGLAHNNLRVILPIEWKVVGRRD